MFFPSLNDWSIFSLYIPRFFDHTVILDKVVTGFKVCLKSLLFGWIGGLSCLLIWVLEIGGCCMLQQWLGEYAGIIWQVVFIGGLVEDDDYLFWL